MLPPSGADPCQTDATIPRPGAGGGCRALRRAGAACLLALVLLIQPGPAPAAGERERARLEAVREQRQALEKKLKDAEASRAAATARLRETERAVAASVRKLRSLEGERGAASAELTAHQGQLERLTAHTAARQEQLARLLRDQFRPGAANPLAELLAGGDRRAPERDRHFLALLSRAQADRIAALRHDATETRRLAAEVQRRGERLAELAQREEAERANLRRRQQERRDALAKISGQIQAQRRDIRTLRQDEQRLGRLIAALAKKSAQARSARPAKPERSPRPGRPPPAQSVQADPVGASGEFARLRGRLIPPVDGRVTGRFGARRADGQSIWKGLFFRAAEGAQVRAVARGTVVFADWLRGYGNLLIIDHDDDFMSVYGNNQTLLAEVGQRVGAGKAVATVGSDGGAAESGLYFELRHRGQAFDPGKWLGVP